MRNAAIPVGLIVTLVGTLALGGCDGGGGNEGQASLVGGWTYSGRVPNMVTVALIFGPDQTFTFVEQVAPVTSPAGSGPSTCVTSHNFSAAYVQAANTLTWTFTQGTRNVVSGCGDASSDSAGTPMTADDITAYTNQGEFPPTNLTYSVTATTLVLTSSVSGVGVGRSDGTTFTKLHYR
ncbi:MAG TPA: hypothetical protein VIF57_19170 [Polyangia bacterium]|jgi:hypothetical protein